MKRADGKARSHAAVLAITAVISLLLAGSGAHAGSGESPATTGGTSGFAFFEITGIDARGRLLLSGELTSGHTFVWADGESVARISGSPPGLYPVGRPWSVAFSPGGKLATLAAEGPSSERASAIVILEPPPQRVVALGDRTPEGDAICGVGPLAINDAGTLAFLAAIAAPGEDCYERERSGIYVTTDDGLRTEVTTDDFESQEYSRAFFDVELRLVALLPDGAVIFSVTEDLGDAPEAVLVSRDRQARCLTGDGAPDGMGCVLHPQYFVLASSAAGEVLLLEPRHAVWRTDHGMLRHVVARGDVLPNGAVVGDLTYGGTEGYLNSSGDAIVLVGCSDPTTGTQSCGTLLVPGGGGAPALLPPYPRGLNDGGQIALLVLDHDSVPGDELSVATRWSDGVAQTVYVEGDPVPNARANTVPAGGDGCSLNPNAGQTGGPAVLVLSVLAILGVGFRTTTGDGTSGSRSGSVHKGQSPP
jgi:hypothetical protein